MTGDDEVRDGSLEQLRDLVFKEAVMTIQAGNVQEAERWSDLALKLEERLWQFSKMKERTSNLEVDLTSSGLHTGTTGEGESVRSSDPVDIQKMRRSWWESVDEIVFLYIALAFSFTSEIIAQFWQMWAIFLIAVLMFAVVMGYVYWKWKFFFRG